MKYLSNFKHSSGQALLLVLLGMAVVLTLSLSIVSRSITDVNITSRGEDYIRAFSAAEAGIEQVLTIGTGTSGSFSNNASYTASITDLGGGSSNYTYPFDLFSGESATIWFVSHDASGNISCNGLPCFSGNAIKVCWGKSGTAPETDETPAIEMSLYYKTPRPLPDNDFSDVQVYRDPRDPNQVRRDTLNNFGSASNSPDCGTDFAFYADFDLSGLGLSCVGIPGCMLFAKIKMIYNNSGHKLAVQTSGGTLPSQGFLIPSIGTAGESQARLEASQTYPEPPGIFDSGIFSLGGGASVKP